jgi:hypothetical protein
VDFGEASKHRKLKQVIRTRTGGGFNPSEKYQSVGMIIPNIWENKQCSKPPTI